MDREIERLCRERYPETERLRQVKGVGPITALCFVLTPEEPDRFVGLGVALARETGCRLTGPVVPEGLLGHPDSGAAEVLPFRSSRPGGPSHGS